MSNCSNVLSLNNISHVKDRFSLLKATLNYRNDNSFFYTFQNLQATIYLSANKENHSLEGSEIKNNHSSWMILKDLHNNFLIFNLGVYKFITF